MSDNQIKGLADIVTSAAKDSTERYWKNQVVIAEMGAIDAAQLKEHIRRVQQNFLDAFQRELFRDDSPLLTPEERAELRAKCEAERREYNKLRNRIKRTYRDYKARISDAWLVLKGEAEIKGDDDEDY